MSVSKDKRTGKWMCRVSYQDIHGNYKQKTRKGFDTKKEAQLNEAELKINIENGLLDENLTNKNVSFADYFEDWIYMYKIDRNLSKSTEKKYIYVSKLIREYFGNIPFDQITRKKYQKFLDFRGKNRSKDSVERTNAYIRACVKDALFDKVIETDFTYNVVLSYDVETQSRTSKYWDLEEFKTLVKYLEADISVQATILIIQAHTGLRIGEVFGLAWKDIDFDNKTLSVKRGYDYTNTYSFTNAKTEAAHRTIFISDDLILALKRHKLIYGKKCNEYLFVVRIAKRFEPVISYNAVKLWLDRVCKKLKIARRSPHALRHTHCSLLIAQDVDIAYISQRLGHKSLNETIKTYAHLIKEKKQKEDKKAIQAIQILSK
ncbi:tyrosine-type recombinase/integrase [Ignavigranum ruoffiae]|uniref:site-specific integrase n=1 Tax=Ignavigranum ruoffiae TaxID=89093 RepID=UPI00235521A0|nr:tyrosine-type recombinase/integrase [Ignavigranum ruoffiae]